MKLLQVYVNGSGIEPEDSGDLAEEGGSYRA